MKKLALIFAVVFGLGGAGADAADVTRGGTFVYSTSADCIFLDPVNTQQNPDIWISLNIFDTLLHPSADGKTVEPALASAFKVADDALSITFTIRPNIKFADGSPIELSDIKFSLDRARDKASGEFNFLLESIASVDMAPPDKIIVRLSRPDPAILQALSTFNSGIVPEKLLKAAPGTTIAEKAKAFAQKPIGSGPFIVTSWTKGSEMVLTRNPYYWQQGADGKPLPYVDEVKIEIIPDDATRILKLKAGEIDGAEAVPLSRVAELKADPSLNMAIFPSARTIYIAMNNRSSLKDGTKNPLSDKKVRHALNYAIDKEVLSKVMTNGVGTPQNTLMPSSTPHAYIEKGQPYPYDLAKARDLIKEAGYDNGFDVSIYAIAGSADDVTELSIVQQMWAQIGARLKIEPLDTTTRIAKFKNDDYQMRTAIWTNDINDPSEITSYFAYFPVFESNRSGFRNKELEDNFLKSQSEIDFAKRDALYKRIQEIYIEEAPMVFLLELPYPVALSNKVKDFTQIPLGNYLFANVHLEK